MARMLGRFESPGCCPGTRSGWHRRRHLTRLDCCGAGTSTRRRKRVEQRELAHELRPEGLLPAPFDDPTDCAHGCNGDCVYSGSDVCNFTCHDDLDQRAHDVFDRMDRLVAERLGEEFLAFSETSLPLTAEACDVINAADWQGISRAWADWLCREDQAYDSL